MVGGRTLSRFAHKCGSGDLSWQMRPIPGLLLGLVVGPWFAGNAADRAKVKKLLGHGGATSAVRRSGRNRVTSKDERQHGE